MAWPLAIAAIAGLASAGIGAASASGDRKQAGSLIAQSVAYSDRDWET